MTDNNPTDPVPATAPEVTTPPTDPPTRTGLRRRLGSRVVIASAAVVVGLLAGGVVGALIFSNQFHHEGVAQTGSQMAAPQAPSSPQARESNVQFASCDDDDPNGAHHTSGAPNGNHDGDDRDHAPRQAPAPSPAPAPPR